MAKGVYTDDFQTPLTEIVRVQLLAILGAAYPDWYVSHSTAALHQPVSGIAFVSGPKQTRAPIELPGVEVKRLPSLRHPETIVLRLEHPVAPTLSAESSEAEVEVSSPLQTVFEVLSHDGRQPERTLPDELVHKLIEDLTETDRHRAESFARRNGLERELERFERLCRPVRILPPNRQGLEVYFYHYEVGRLESLPHREYRFTYHADWDIELSGLPKPQNGPAYEGSALPPFFDNLLPEGWSEEKLRAVHKIDRDDTFALLRTTPKYLSNLTLRPDGFSADRVALDYLETEFRDVSEDPVEILAVVETIGEDPDSRELWEELGQRGATRLSGVQPKLPVHLRSSGGRLEVDLSGYNNTTTHILKLPSPVYPELIENEWATMELARRVGLSVAPVRRVSFHGGSELRGPGLLIERFDIPRVLEGAEPLILLEDGASLLGLPRIDKYRTSLERVAGKLQASGIGQGSMERFLDHVAFSWLVGNGDLHAKNLSVLREIDANRFGRSPAAAEVRYSPLYDLVNTRVVLPGDLYALSLNGKRDNLRLRHFVDFADRCGLGRAVSRDRLSDLARRIMSHMSDVLDAAGLSAERTESYRKIVQDNVSSF